MTHELALAQRQLADVAAAQMPDARPARSRRRRRPVGRRAGPSSGCSCGIRPSATTSSTRIANGSSTWPGTTAMRRASAGRSDLGERDAVEQHDAAGSGASAGEAASSSTCRRRWGRRGTTRSPAADAQVDVASSTCRRRTRADDRDRDVERRAAHSSYPARKRRSSTRKNGAPMTAVTTPTGSSPGMRATRSASDQERRAEDAPTAAARAARSARRAAARRAARRARRSRSARSAPPRRP